MSPNASTSTFDFEPIQDLAIARANEFDVLDERIEWEKFSKSISDTDINPVWKSHIVIEGMHCAACAFQIEDVLKKTPGVLDVQVDASSHRANVTWIENTSKPSVWMDRLKQLGYKALPANDQALRDARHIETRRHLWRVAVAGFCMMQVMMYSVPPYLSEPEEIHASVLNLLHWASWVLCLPVVIFSCQSYWKNAWRDLQKRQVSMDLPVALGMAITFVVSSIATFDPQGVWGSEVYFDSFTMFVFFLLTGRWFESRLRDQTAGALDALMNAMPASVDRRSSNGLIERIAVDRLALNDVIGVKPGEKFPVDGMVLEGDTWVEEAMLTGESKPVFRTTGEKVWAGSHNLSQTIWMQITQLGESTQYAQIISLMHEAALNKPRLAVIADRIARPFLIGVLIAAALAAVYAWPQGIGQAWMVAVAVLIVTCPCAMSLATPAAMLASAGRMARSGILVRNLQALENLSRIDTVIFDKTGTLTRDVQRMKTIVSAEGVYKIEEELPTKTQNWVDHAAALAQNSLHPLSRAIADQSNALLLSYGVNETPGKGLQGQVMLQGEIKNYRLGSLVYCEEWLGMGVIPSSVHDYQVHLCSETQWLLSFDGSDALRSDAITTISELKKLDVQVEILSGDRQKAVNTVARQLDISPTCTRGGVTPAQKLEYMKWLQLRGRRILMVGDGLNDLPVLAGANVSIVMGRSAAIAQSRSDMVVMGHSLQAVVHSIQLAKQTMRVVKHNLLWAALYNAICVPLAVMGWLPAWLAGLGMAISSLWVVLHALQLSRFKFQAL